MLTQWHELSSGFQKTSCLKPSSKIMTYMRTEFFQTLGSLGRSNN